MENEDFSLADFDADNSVDDLLASGADNKKFDVDAYIRGDIDYA